MDIKLLSPSHLLYHASQPIYDIKEGENVCSICGYGVDELVFKNFSSNYSDLEIFRNKEQFQYVCHACNHALNHLSDLHKVYLLTPDNITFTKRSGTADNNNLGNTFVVQGDYHMKLMLQLPKNQPFVFMIAHGQNRRHSLLRSKVNYGNTDFFWLCENLNQYRIPLKDLDNLLAAMIKIRLLQAETSINRITQLNIKPSDNYKFYSLWNDVSPTLKNHVHRPYYELIKSKIVPNRQYLQEHYPNDLEKIKEKLNN